MDLSPKEVAVWFVNYILNFIFNATTGKIIFAVVLITIVIGIIIYKYKNRKNKKDKIKS